MNTSSHDFVTVDMRGLKDALVARARAQRVCVSILVRAAVARELAINHALGTDWMDISSANISAAAAAVTAGTTPTAIPTLTVKLSIRFTATEAAQLSAGAHLAGLARGAYIAGLMADVPAVSGSANRPEYLHALISSCAELSTLSRDIHRLTSLLRQANVPAARQYWARLDSLAGAVSRHLSVAAAVLADLRPRRPRSDVSKRPAT